MTGSADEKSRATGAEGRAEHHSNRTLAVRLRRRLGCLALMLSPSSSVAVVALSDRNESDPGRRAARGPILERYQVTLRSWRI
jgi:hypothetical protein